MSFQLKQAEPFPGNDLIKLSPFRWITPKAALAEESVAKQYLHVLRSYHLPHHYGGEPAAFAGETPIPTPVGVSAPGCLGLRACWAKRFSRYHPTRQKMKPRSHTWQKYM